jgi:hypothetical protein
MPYCFAVKLTGVTSFQPNFNRKLCGAPAGHLFSKAFDLIHFSINVLCPHLQPRDARGGARGLKFIKAWGGAVAPGHLPFLISRELITNGDRAILLHLHQSMDAPFFHLHHRIPSHVSQETCSSFPSWS